jgi:hypothetical protein
VQKRFSRGFTFNANYTFSKFMQAINLLNAADIQPVREISDQDTPHRVTVSGIYELPFGRGKAWLHPGNPIASRLLSGLADQRNCQLPVRIPDRLGQRDRARSLEDPAALRSANHLALLQHGGLRYGLRRPTRIKRPHIPAAFLADPAAGAVHDGPGAHQEHAHHGRQAASVPRGGLKMR